MSVMQDVPAAQDPRELVSAGHAQLAVHVLEMVVHGPHGQDREAR